VGAVEADGGASDGAVPNAAGRRVASGASVGTLGAQAPTIEARPPGQAGPAKGDEKLTTVHRASLEAPVGPGGSSLDGAAVRGLRTVSLRADFDAWSLRKPYG